MAADTASSLRLLALLARPAAPIPSTETDAALSQAVEQLQEACLSQEQPDLLARVLPGLSRTFQRTLAQSALTPNSVHVLLAVLQFYLTFGEEVVHEADKSFHAFFRSFLARQYGDPVVAALVVKFLNQQKAKLLASCPAILPQYFPLLLKIQAWHSPRVDADMLDLFPAIVAPGSFLPLYPSLLDLPTLVLALEDFQKTAGGLPGEGPSAAPKPPAPEDVLALMDAAYTGSTAAGRADSDSGDEAGERSGRESLSALFKELLKDENEGLTEGHWSYPGLPEALSSVLDSPPSMRLQRIMQIVPKLLQIYFKVALRDVEDERLAALLAMVFQRVDSMFPNPSFCQEVQHVCLEASLSIFDCAPRLVALLRKPIIDCIGQPFLTAAKAEFAMHLCWAIGEHAGGGIAYRAEATQLFESIELLLYENLAASTAAAKNPEQDRESDMAFTALGGAYGRARLLCFAITSLSKLATSHRELVPRARVCLSKVIRSSQFLDERVGRRAREHFGLMQNPAICASILGRTNRATKGRLGGDADSAVAVEDGQNSSAVLLPFYLLKERRGLPLHDFSLDDVLVG